MEGNGASKMYLTDFIHVVTTNSQRQAGTSNSVAHGSVPHAAQASRSYYLIEQNLARKFSLC